MTLLQMSFIPEDEWHGELVATCSHDQFSGRGSAWFTKEDIRAFAEALSAYPLDPENLPSLAGGYWSNGVDAIEPMDVHLGIEVAPYDALGRLRLTVRLASEAWGAEDQSLECRATFRFLGTYSDIGSFASALLGLANGQNETEVQFPG